MTLPRVLVIATTIGAATGAATGLGLWAGWVSTDRLADWAMRFVVIR